MSTDLVIQGQGSTSLSIEPEQTGFNENQVAALRHMGVENASEGDLAVFFHVVKRTGLDPFARQIHMVGRNSKDQRTNQWVTKYTIQTGIDGYRLIGRRAADRRGDTIAISAPEWAHEDGTWRQVWRAAWGVPVGARVTIRRGDLPFTAVALFDEYKQTKRDGDLNSMWAQRPAGQIAKCAEALAWRMAFPQDLAGLYVEDEMHHADQAAEAQRPIERSGAARMRAAVRPEAPTAAEDVQDAEVVDDAPAADPITEAQTRKMGALMREAGLTDRADAIAYVVETIGRDVASRSELTKAEASVVIDALTALTAPRTDDTAALEATWGAEQ